MKKHRRILVIAIAVIVLGLVGIQLWPTGFDRTNPPVVAEPPWDQAETRLLTVRACYDCHSNETKWPWYSRIAPLSWMIEQDVAKGRAVLNFSEWGSAPTPETEETVELISKGQMPLPYYLVLHPEARLSQVEQGQLINGLITTFSGGAPTPLDDEDLDAGSDG
jgi:hypothetical protein